VKLVASLIVHNEASKYLKQCIESLQGFVDEIRAVDDASTDGSHSLMQEMGVHVHRNDRSVFYEHEGRARQQLLEWTMEAEPTHVLVVDGDELVVDGDKLREALTAPQPFPTLRERRQRGRGSQPATVWRLQMQEVWGATEQHLLIRQDGGWKEHPVPICYAIPVMQHGDRRAIRHWRIPDRALACGRVPVEVAVASNRSLNAAAATCLHLGWACEADRYARHQRYVVHDGGVHHASRHLDSIMWDDSRVQLSSRPWPAGVDKQKILERINRT
jgi:glycosyltransferase involved in cell wall biosynthesis